MHATRGAHREYDGRGIDVNAVQKRAREAGLLREDENMDLARVLDVISAPGVSTRETADLASGRGVGMAVVRKELRGDFRSVPFGIPFFWNAWLEKK